MQRRERPANKIPKLCVLIITEKLNKDNKDNMQNEKGSTSSDINHLIERFNQANTIKQLKT